MITAGGRAICSEIQKLKNCIWNKEDLPEEWNEPIIVPIYKTVAIIEAYPCYQLHIKFYPTFFCHR